jgi:predicted transcriptional regulator
MATSQGIKLDEETQKRLKALAEKRRRSPHWIMRDAIERYLTEEEQYEQEKAEDLAEYEDYLVTGKAIDNIEVSVWLEGLAHGKKTSWSKQK